MIPSPLLPYVPDLLLQRLESARPVATDGQEEILAATLFADLAGFTSMADRLAERGAQGPEQLTEVLDHVFGSIIDRVLRHGGDVLRFAGDAVLVAWIAASQEELPQRLHRAAACALEAQRAPLGHHWLPDVSLRLRVGIGAGPLRLLRVGGMRDRWEFAFIGEALRSMGTAADLASVGQVVLAPEARELLGAEADGRPGPEGSFLLEGLGARALRALTPQAPERQAFPSVAEGSLRPFISAVVRQRIDAGMGSWLAELRPLSVLFINLPLPPGEELPDQDQLQQLVHQAQRELYRFEGTMDKILMDEKGCTLVAAFGLPPLAHEDDPERALRAAMAVAERLAGRGVSFRIGVATGRVYAGAYGHPLRREYSILGATVNLAARLMQHARDEVLCDAATRRAVGRRVELEPLAPTRVKGKREEVQPWRPLRSLDPALDSAVITLREGVEEPPARPVFGRVAERETLDRALRALADRGQGGGILLRGDPGIGKSALISWLLARAQGLGVRACFGSSDAIERTMAYRAWRPVVAGLLGAAGAEGVDATRAAVLEALSAHPEGERWAPLLDALLPLGLPENDVTAAMTGAARAENTREMTVQLLRARMGGEPLLVVLEDGHWMDPASWALAAAVQRLLPSVLLVVGTRPMGEEAPPELQAMLAEGWTGRVVDLAAMAPAELCEVAAAALDVDALPERVERLLLRHAEGNPFYVQELALALRDLGILEVEDRRCRLRADGEEGEQLRLPDTVQGAITSRLDRLDPQHQLTLKVASVVGRDFLYQVTHDVHPVPKGRERVGAHLEQSARGGLIQVEERDPQLVYRFGHSITQQVAYNLLAFSQRREIHGAVARWYEGAGADEDGAMLGRLAHHWHQAGDDARTLHYCLRAGEQAFALGSMSEAVHFLRRAVPLMEQGPTLRRRSPERMHRVRVRRKLGEAYASVSENHLALGQLQLALVELGQPFPRRGPRQALRGLLELGRMALLQALPSLWRRLSPAARERVEEAARLEARLADALIALTDLRGMVVASMSAINHAERAGVFEAAAHAYNAIGYVLGVAGLRRLGERFLQRARSGGALAACNGHYARGLWLLGDARLQQAEDEIRLGLEQARSVGETQAIATGLSCLGTRFELTGDYDAALRLWRELFDIARHVADVRHEFWATIAIGGALSMLGRESEGLDWIRRQEELLAREDAMTAVGFHGQRAQAFLRAGEPSLARESADLTMTYVLETGTNVFTHVKGLTGMCETYLGLWEASEDPPAADLRRAALGACGLFRRYARRFPMGVSRAARMAGTAAWLDSRPRRARALWRRAIERARALHLDYDELMAHREIVRLLPPDEPARAEHEEQARALEASRAEAIERAAAG